MRGLVLHREAEVALISPCRPSS
ncbi:MAG: hypothetical protein ACN6OP_23675 [Pseudomonadales bacterium]